MTEDVQVSHPSLVSGTIDIVTSYVSANHIGVDQIARLIAETYIGLRGLDRIAPGADPKSAEPEVKQPTASEIKKSITPDAIISFIDGKPYKTMKRHLGTHGLDPHSYRQRYGLPSDYPMVAPSYAAQRSALAKSIGLGVPGGRLRKAA